MVRTYRCLLAEQLFKESVQNSSLSVQGEASNHLQINKVLREKNTPNNITPENNFFSKAMPLNVRQDIFAALEGKDE